MKKSQRLGILALMIGCGITFDHSAAFEPPSPPLPVRKVVLFSSGVGFFQHAGVINGDDTIHLPFSKNQINDVLKSLVVENLDGGKPGLVLYPTRDPQTRILGNFQVDLRADPAISEILSQLRGTEMEVDFNGEKIIGNLVTVEKRPMNLPGTKKPVTDWMLTLNSSMGLKTVPLQNIGIIRLLDSDLEKDLNKALMALNRDRGRNQKPIAIQLSGTGDKRIRLGYVIETPVWKTSYRLILPEDGNDKEPALIQGWAIIENQSDNDWQQVELNLVSGRPISFIQNLHEPLYRTRPVVETAMTPSVGPRKYDAGFGGRSEKTGRGKDREEESLSMGFDRKKAVQSHSFAARMAMAPPSPEEGMNGQPEKSTEESPWQREDLLPTGANVAAEESGTLFRFILKNVDLPRHQGAMIPFIADPINAERISIYNQAILADHPLNGIRLDNTSQKNLPAGPVTLFDGGIYSGDALLTDLPAGQQRLLAYAVDLNIKVITQSEPDQDEITSGKIVGGILTVMRKHRLQQKYTLENSGDQEKMVIIEHPRHPGWQLAEPTQPMETTARYHRFKRHVSANGTVEFRVIEERIREQRLTLMHGNPTVLLELRHNDHLSKSVQKALQRIINQQRKIEKERQALRDTDRQIRTLHQEQKRIRDNLKSVRHGSPFHSRMLDKLDGQETDIERTRTRAQTIRHRLENDQRILEKQLSELNVN